MRILHILLIILLFSCCKSEKGLDVDQRAVKTDQSLQEEVSLIILGTIRDPILSLFLRGFGQS